MGDEATILEGGQIIQHLGEQWPGLWISCQKRLGGTGGFEA